MVLKKLGVTLAIPLLLSSCNEEVRLPVNSKAGARAAKIMIPSYPIALKWNSNIEKAVNSSGGGYRIYYANKSGFSLTEGTRVEVPYESGTATPTEKSLLLPAGTYYFKILAFSPFGMSEATEEQSVTIP